MDNNNYVSTNNQLLKGTFDLAVLLLLNQEPMYGYQLTKQLRDGGIYSIADGSIYPIMRRLTKKGLVYSYDEEFEGRHRKYYTTTPEGSKTAQENYESFVKIFKFIKTLKR